MCIRDRDTVGEVIRKYSSYKYRSSEARSDYEDRKTRMLGMLLKGLANYHEVVSQEAIMVTGQYIFGSEELSMEEKYDAFRQIYKTVSYTHLDVYKRQGDDSNISLWIVVMLAAGAALTGTVLYGRKKSFGK